MNYELRNSITRMSVRLYERAGQPNVWISPNNYELRITNFYYTHVRASLREGRSTKCVDFPQ